MLHLVLSFLWCCNLDSFESTSKIPGKLRSVVLEKVGEDHLRNKEVMHSQG